MSTYNFQATIATCGYVYIETTWSNAKVRYVCTVKAKEKYFDGWKSIGHVPKGISRYIYFFLKKEIWKITGHVESLNYKSSPIPSGRPECLCY